MDNVPLPAELERFAAEVVAASRHRDVAEIVAAGVGLLQGVTLLYAKGPVGGVLGLPVAAAAILIVFVIAALLLRLTPFGRYVYAVGDDPAAAGAGGGDQLFGP